MISYTYLRRILNQILRAVSNIQTYLEIKFLVPTGPPVNLRAILVSRSTSLNVSWQLPLINERNGIIDNFIIYYSPIGVSFTALQTVVPGDITSYQLRDLQIWTNYSISVCAITIALGPCSQSIYAQTDEAGRYLKIYFYEVQLLHVINC